VQSGSLQVGWSLFRAETKIMGEPNSDGGYSTHHGVTLAEIEKRLRADGHSQEEIDSTLGIVVAVREELSRRGKWPAPKEERPS
jgi:hypothetical protein